MAEKKRGGVVKKILIAIAVVLIVFLGIVALQPADFRITRSATIDAPPETVFAQVNDFHKWEAWSPWAKLDPNAKNSFEGPSAGTGAKFHWSGNSEVGEGGMTITESQPNDLIRIRLEFIRPFAATNTTEFTFVPEKNGTKINWSMAGTNNFVGRIFCMFMNMDEMVGKDFEKGLASMKAVAEAESKSPAEDQPATESADEKQAQQERPDACGGPIRSDVRAQSRFLRISRAGCRICVLPDDHKSEGGQIDRKWPPSRFINGGTFRHGVSICVSAVRPAHAPLKFEWKKMMNRIDCPVLLRSDNDLERVIEPLANYICAADRPRAALASALAVLLKEVKETNLAAIAHFGTFSKPC